jgi:hypothetical protein
MKLMTAISRLRENFIRSSTSVCQSEPAIHGANSLSLQAPMALPLFLTPRSSYAINATVVPQTRSIGQPQRLGGTSNRGVKVRYLFHV